MSVKAESSNTDSLGPKSTPIAPIPFQDVQQTYMLSSQARNWRFSVGQIEKMRIEGNERARKRIDEVWQRERSLPSIEDEPESSSSNVPIDYLTVAEEQALIGYYLTRVRQLVKAFQLPELVESTTLTFIKRFYLHNTCMDFHPKHVVLTCLFLAAKVENFAIPLKHFATKSAGKEPSAKVVLENTKTVQELEFYISQSLQFEFGVHGAQRALHGILLDFQTIQTNTTIIKNSLTAILQQARANVQQSRLTDAEFIFTPSQIALACVQSSSKEGEDLILQFLESKHQRRSEDWQMEVEQREKWRKTERQRLEKKGIKSEEMPKQLQENETTEIKGRMSVEEILTTLKEINDMIEANRQFNIENTTDKVKEIDKKLRACQNPERMSNSRLKHHSEQEKKVAVLGKRDSSKNRTTATTTAENNQLSASVLIGNEDDDDDDDDIENIENPSEKKRLKIEQ